MLSYDQIVKLLKDEEIDISVSFYKEGKDILRYETDKPLLASLSSDNLYSDRLRVSIGPIIKSLNKQIAPQKAFKNKVNCVDLRETNNRYIIDPGESIVALTNEKFGLKGKCGCLIIPRLSMSEVGLVVSTSYIDAYYEGITRLEITNVSNKPYELHILEAIAQCFFFELGVEAPKTFKQSFPGKSVFWGLNWTQILDSDAEPFPTKKEYTRVNPLSSIRHQWGLVVQFCKKNAIFMLLLTNLAAIIAGYNLVNKEYLHFKNAINQVEMMLEPVASEIILEAENDNAQKEVIIDIPKADIITILCNNDDISFSLMSGDSSDKTKIIFTYRKAASSKEVGEIAFTYTVIRRMAK